MSFSTLSCSGFRNLKQVDINVGSKFVIFSGDNGSGKTSLLEALYFLAHARSFRVSNLKKLICHDSDLFSVFSRLSENGVTVGIERDVSGKQRIRFDGETISGIAPVAQALPLQFLDTDAHRMLASSPANRRSFLDWGVFHVEHSFSKEWQVYQKILRQRNYALKSCAPRLELDAWTEQLAVSGNNITKCRERYVENFSGSFEKLWQDLMPGFAVPCLVFSRGWSGGDLCSALYNSLDQDKRYGYTTVGPHRSDLKIEQNNRSIFDFFSQGQQKSLMYALKVAQGLFLKKETGKNVVYLIDDLPAELDQMRLGLVLNVLQQHASQVFVTAIDRGLVFNSLGSDCCFFNVSSGVVEAC